MKIVLVDNYDSFTHILAQYLREQNGVDLTIVMNDEWEVSRFDQFDKIVISPGPGIPSENGNIIEVIQYYSGKKPILGVCLGMQAMYEAFGGKLINLPNVHHGVSSTVSILDQQDVFWKNVENPFQAGRYHSWVCDPDSIPGSIRITAVDEEGILMACKHQSHPTYGVQFHPESILTPEGKKIIANFVKLQTQVFT